MEDPPAVATSAAAPRGGEGASSAAPERERSPEPGWTAGGGAGPSPARDPFASEAPPRSTPSDDPFWFRSAGALLGNEAHEAEAGPAPYGGRAELEAAARQPADAGAAPPLAPAAENEADLTLAAYLQTKSLAMPELETPAVPPPSVASPADVAASPEHQPDSPSHGFELAWPDGGQTAKAQFALEDPLRRTGAAPLDGGDDPALDTGPSDPWAGTGTFAMPMTGTATGAAALPQPSAAPLPAAAEPDALPAAPAASTERRPPPRPEVAPPVPSPRPTPRPPAPRAPAAQEAPSPDARPRHRAVVSESLWLAVPALLAVALLVGWRSHLLSRLQDAVSRRGAPVVELSGVRGGLYDTSSGAPALVVRGEVVARAAVTGPVRIRVELLDGRRTVASGEALAGAIATPEEVFASSAGDAASELRRTLDARAARGMTPGARAPFLVVFPPPAPEPQGLELRATAEPVDAVTGR